MNKNVKILYVEIMNKQYNYMVGRIINEHKFEPAAKSLGIRFKLWCEAIDCGHYGFASIRPLERR